MALTKPQHPLARQLIEAQGTAAQKAAVPLLIEQLQLPVKPRSYALLRFVQRPVPGEAGRDAAQLLRVVPGGQLSILSTARNASLGT